MNKLSFRARSLDVHKSLPIYRAEDLTDLSECAAINRAVPQMPTGMEKEEESTCPSLATFTKTKVHRKCRLRLDHTAKDLVRPTLIG
ncbi:Enhancer of polycomb-like protein 2 [Trichoplax sp. H2]|nr:Enhancer of polycomb-like protein 2 [Trichoplax sp. H2]|eukprot:RDD36714.1 Enhancer of polycomb-like protein 2 [Trichoplax sp. H2]